jgi:hypothetical protein
MKELKVIDIKEKKFTANGTDYFIESGLSFERFRMYQKLQIECGYEVGFEGMFNRIKQIYDLCNAMKFADIAVLTSNILQGVVKVEERKIPVLSMCALFINTKDEDRKTINDDVVDKKIADWEAEGLDITPFFQLALSSMANFSKAWEEVTRNILEKSQEIGVKKP